MFSDYKSVQILVALLKAHNIKRVVVSPGNRNVPIVHSLENDDFFTTYSVVDERSAGFFGIGLIHRYNEPVAICCTSGTAVCNYYSAITEAYYQKLPLLAITADRNPQYLNQDEEQMLPQVDGFNKVTKAVVSLPIIKDEIDERVAIRMVNEAILELNHHGSGPVQINIPIEGGASFNTSSLPKVSKFERYFIYEQNKEFENIAKTLSSKKVLVIYGQSQPLKDEEVKVIEAFAKKFGAVIATDSLGNLNCQGTVDTFALSRVVDAKTFENMLLPDIVITLNSGYVSYIRSHLRSAKGKFEHWTVNREGRILDTFLSLTKVFEGDAITFMKTMLSYADKKDAKPNYQQEWAKKVDMVNMENVDLPYSNLYLAQQLCKSMEKNSSFHIANSSTVRMVAHFKFDPSIKAYCNRGTNGIDGSASAFMGMACEEENNAYLLIGDLSFFYDMNSLWNNHIKNNMKIILNNNEGATLFHYIIGEKKVPTLNMNIAAEHHAVAKGWVESRGFKYFAVHNKDELKFALEQMNKIKDAPVFIEVFTDKAEDAKILKEIYANYTKQFPSDAKGFLKGLFKR